MVIRVLAMLVWATVATAGTMTCTYDGDTRAITPHFYFAAGACTMSTSYATGGDLFPGSGTAGQNAAVSLCGYTGATIRTVVLAGQSEGMLFQYDDSAFTIKIFYPTHEIDDSFPITGLAATNSVPTFTVTKGAILASSELGLSADATTATVNNNTIASTRVLSTNSPVSAPAITFTPGATAVILTNPRSGTQVPAATDASNRGAIHFIATCTQ